MKSIHYAGDVVLTGDAIATAVVEYAAALAKRETAAEVTIPVVTADGDVSEASLLLGPASQLVVGPADIEVDELVDEAVLAALLRATTELGPTQAHEIDEGSVPSPNEDYGI